MDSDLLIIDVLSSSVGAKASFSCPQGYGLRGEFEAECLESGFWSAEIPHCKPVSCNALEPPDDGYILGAGVEGEAKVYRGGDLIQFSCNADFMMIGTGIVVCQENERWSAQVPKCEYITKSLTSLIGWKTARFANIHCSDSSQF